MAPAAHAGAVAPFVGDWVNVDPNTPGISRVRITAPGDIAVEAWGACVPTDCVWGAQHVAQAEADDGVVTVRWQFAGGVVSEKVDFSLQSDGTLAAFDCSINSRCYTWTFRRTSAPAVLYGFVVAVTGAGVVDSGNPAILCPMLCTADVQSGFELLLTPRAGPGAYFDHWSGACTGTSVLCRVTVTAAASVSAAFVSPQVTLAPPRASRSAVAFAGTASEGAVIEVVATGRKRVLRTFTTTAGAFRSTWRLQAGRYTLAATASVHGLSLPLGRWAVRVP